MKVKATDKKLYISDVIKSLDDKIAEQEKYVDSLATDKLMNWWDFDSKKQLDLQESKIKLRGLKELRNSL